MTRLYVDGPTLLRAVRAATRNLERHVDEVDALNVFPVPDGDTGSNMLATMRASLAEAERLPASERDLHTVAEALSRGALTGARGNSGVILSQIIRGMTTGADGRRRANGVDLATGLRRGSESAYQSVLTPVEGTILTVIRDAAEAAELAAGRQPHVEAVLAEAIEAAAFSVQRTPTLLPVLEDAGVVDSGGQGLYRVLEGMLQVDGSLALPPVNVPTAAAPSRPAAPGHPATDEAGAHGYETQYVVSAAAGGIDLAALRAAIDAAGVSVVVAGDATLARVHVHGERPDAAIAAGLRWGRLGQVEIIDLDAHVAETGSRHDHDGAPPRAAGTRPRGAGVPSRAAPSPRSSAPATGIVSVTRAPGIASVFESLGAHVVVPGHGSRPSVGEIVEGIVAVGAPAVIVLPNDRDALLAAAQAVALVPDVAVEVVPTRNAAEGIAAAIAFDAAASLADNAVVMAAESSAIRSFRVFTAARDAVVDGTPVRAGQVLALDAESRLLAMGADVEAVTLEALATFEGFELVTVYAGRSEDDWSCAALCQRVELAGFGAEVELVDGGQLHDHLLVAVE